METKRTIYLISGAACLFLAVGLILYPLLGNALAEKNKSLVMTEYSRAVEEMTDARVEEMLAAADEYNAALSGTAITFSAGWEYRPSGADYDDRQAPMPAVSRNV